MKIYLYKIVIILGLLGIYKTAQAQKDHARCFRDFQSYKLEPLIHLARELNTGRPASGGKIVVTQKNNQSILVQRNHCATRDNNAELHSRYKNWLLFKQLHLSTKYGEVFNGSLPVSEKLKSFLKSFAMSPAGALWVQKIINFDLHLIQTQYYKVLINNHNITIVPSEDFLIDLAYSKFYITETDSNTYAAGNFIAINKNFLNKKLFSHSKQKVDHLAILSHEFGHTNFGDPSTRGSIYAEAVTVERYENPVRIANHFMPRKSYFDLQSSQSIDIYTKTITKH